jgi:hypothetical protein
MWPGRSHTRRNLVQPIEGRPWIHAGVRVGRHRHDARQVQHLVPRYGLGKGFDVIGIGSPAPWVRNRIHTHLQQDLHRFSVESFYGTGKRRDEFVPVDRFDDVGPSGNGRHFVAL